MPYANFENDITPSTPSTGFTKLFVDSGDGHTKQIDDTGTVTDLVSGGFWSRTGTYLYPTTITDFVGIGTATPVYQLDIVGDNASGINYISTGNY